jgi:hypothetical protein
VNTLALVPAAAIVLLAARGLLSDGDKLLRSRGPGLAVCTCASLDMDLLSIHGYTLRRTLPHEAPVVARNPPSAR